MLSPPAGSPSSFTVGMCTVQAVYDAKSEEIGPGVYRFKAEIGERWIPVGRPVTLACLCLPCLCSARTSIGTVWPGD